MIFWLKDKTPIRVGTLLKISFPKLNKREIKKFIKQGKILLNDEPVFDENKLAYENDEIKFHGDFVKLKRKGKEKKEEPTEIIKHKRTVQRQWDEFSDTKILDIDIERISLKFHKLLLTSKLTISFAESCTGGLLQEISTRHSGSSAYFLGGVVTYSLKSKRKLLDVKKSTLKKFGAVSSETAMEMAYGLKRLFESDIAVSVTGIAGPTGGTKEKPVGTVYYSIVFNDKNYQKKLSLDGKREVIKKKTAIEIMKNLIKLIEKYGEDK